ncbi:MAG: GGDEF domain-containing protein [Lachnospiraceae bacterium]|jgi:diguanylate cyclase (GGDEF)-like protein|nr:GGDEF domain-containing protein [Lachnospiraceae bacterium]
MSEQIKETVSEESKKPSLRGIRIQTLSFWIVACTLLVAVLIGAGIFSVLNHCHTLVNMTKEYILTETDVMNMSLGSDYLTEQARQYVIFQDSRYADAYFTEAEVTQRRDQALLSMKDHAGEEDTVSLELLSQALDTSNALMELEIHAMKLAAVSAGVDMSVLPTRLQTWSLTEEELGYSSREKLTAAYQLVFGSEYQHMKKETNEKLSSVTTNVISSCSMRQLESESRVRSALIRQSVYTALIVGLVIMAYMMIAMLILRPIRVYINCMKNNHALDITGAYEFKYLAITYNNVFKIAQANQNMLRYKAETDALTGLLNREAFEQLKLRFQDAPQPLTLMLIDVDVFKSINDNYGHETGDRALIRTANLLRENFRAQDHVLRIGGDEFAILLEDIQADRTEIIRDKVERINWTLQHPQNDLPRFSLSVGVAFSEQGYNDELFRQADQALYQTKENGRCGCTFHFL